MDVGAFFDQWVEGAIARDKQVDARGVHLTVAVVLEAHTKGRIDLGGSEHRPAVAHPVQLFERSHGDKFAWWRLEPGTYIVRFNEKLRPGAPVALLASNDRLLEGGCAIAPAICLGGEEISSVLTVPACGLQLKQDAKIAVLRPLG
jgi:hypothetical protein